ncbi:MAG: amidohydrolase family protein, partial [Lachnospiraceae bacterium]|nr:amidohydrolase family protein [Lachnospiraceae bacterium]
VVSCGFVTIEQLCDYCRDKNNSRIIVLDWLNPEAPSGMIGLETAFALAVTHLVNEAGMSLSDVVSKITINPAKLYKFDRGTLGVGKPADITIADVNEKWVVSEKDIKSKSCNTPFLGEELIGKVKYTICDGRIVFKS